MPVGFCQLMVLSLGLFSGFDTAVCIRLHFAASLDHHRLFSLHQRWQTVTLTQLHTGTHDGSGSSLSRLGAPFQGWEP